jgi:hypothetical protein
MSESDFDPIDVLDVLARHEVGFVLIGGMAASVRGSPVITGDIDICYSRDESNFQRLADALTELGAKLRGRGIPDDLPFRLDAATLASGESFTFSTRAGSVDALGTPSGTAGYRDLSGGATRMDIGGRQVAVASVDDLIRMKRAAGRTKDLGHIEWLLALRDETDSGEA